MVKIKITGASSKVHDIFVPVTQAGMVITVPAGPFRYSGKDYELSRDWTYTVTSEGTKTVFGWLALNNSSKDVVVLVDEISVDAPVLFQWAGSGYSQVHELFQLVVPEGVRDLDDVEILVRHVGTRTEG